jgi:hypothetical protein
MLLQPSHERFRLAVGEQINHTVPLEIDEDGAVPVSTTKGEGGQGVVIQTVAKDGARTGLRIIGSVGRGMTVETIRP